MKKILSICFALIAVCAMFTFGSISACAEISPTAATYTHHQHEKETSQVTRIYTRPSKTTKAAKTTKPDRSVPGGTTKPGVPGKDKTTKKATTNPFIEYITDEDGSTVTDVSGNVVTKKPDVTSDKSDESPDTAATGTLKSLALAVVGISAIAVVTVRKKKEISE